MFDYAVVGGGIGGVVAASLLSKIGRKVILFEKLDYLGGCAGTFKKNGMLYNVGATTLVGLGDGYPVRVMLDILGIKDVPVKQIDPSIVVYVGDKVINRYRDRQTSLSQIQKNFYHKNNPILWQKIFQSADNNWKNIYRFLPFKQGISYFIKTGIKNFGYVVNNLAYNVISVRDVTRWYLGDVEEDYRYFLNSQILMTSQGYWDEVSFSTASMGLTYTNLDNYYVIGGMSELLNILSNNITTIYTNTVVKKVKKLSDRFEIRTNRGVFEAKRVILNRNIWNFCDIVEDSSLKYVCHRNIRVYRKMWSSAVLYFHVKDPYNLMDKHHYQIIHKDINPYTGSHSFFVSLSDVEDSKMTTDGYKSVTISTHCKIDMWNNLNKEVYVERKEKLKQFIMDMVYRYLPEMRSMEKTDIMVATPKTFERYTDRYRGSVGGLPMVLDYVPFRYPSNLTDIDGLYLVGDTVFPGQGWPGVVVGAFNLLMLAEKEFYGILHKHLQ